MSCPRAGASRPEPGRYGLIRRGDQAVYGHSAGPQSWKRFLHPPRRKLWSAGPNGQFVEAADETPRYAFLGVRGCDLAAIAKLRTVVRNGQVERTELNIYEPPRFFEAFLRGRTYTEPPDITARVCGICPVAYQTSACSALEQACGVELDPRLADLRRLSAGECPRYRVSGTLDSAHGPVAREK